MPNRKITNRAYQDEKTLVAVLSLTDTIEQASEYFGISHDTLADWIRKEYDCTPTQLRNKVRGNLVGQLKNKAIQKALGGDNQMLKFTITNLSKWSDMPDKQVSEAEKEKPIALNFNKSDKKKRTLEDIEGKAREVKNENQTEA